MEARDKRAKLPATRVERAQQLAKLSAGWKLRAKSARGIADLRRRGKQHWK